MDWRKFNSLVLKAVDFAFDSLGKSCKQALYFHLENTFHVRRVEFPEKIEEFDEAMKLIFKDGVVFVEKLILKKLCYDLGLNFDVGLGSDFAEAISRIKDKVSVGESLLTLSGFVEEVSVTRKKRGGEKG